MKIQKIEIIGSIVVSENAICETLNSMGGTLKVAQKACFIYAGICLILLLICQYVVHYQTTAQVFSVLFTVYFVSGSLIGVMPARDLERLKRIQYMRKFKYL